MNVCFNFPHHTCLAHLYDPKSELSAKLLVINIGALWARASSEETDFITGSNASGANPSGTSWANELAPSVVFGEFIDDGSSQTMMAWIAQHNAQNLYEGADSSYLGTFYSAAAIPLNIVVDLRSMEILAVDVGFDTQMDKTLEAWLAWVATHPPGTWPPQRP